MRRHIIGDALGANSIARGQYLTWSRFGAKKGIGGVLSGFLASVLPFLRVLEVHATSVGVNDLLRPGSDDLGGMQNRVWLS